MSENLSRNNLQACAFCGRYFVCDDVDQRYCNWSCQAQDEERQDLDVDQLSYARFCVVCGESISPDRGRNEIFCSAICRQEKDQQKRDRVKTTAFRGAISELRIAADLLDRGYYVFRSLTLHCQCDLVAWRKDGPLLRVEVKLTEGNLNSKNSRARKMADRNTYDVLAVCCKDTITYLDKSGKETKI